MSSLVLEKLKVTNILYLMQFLCKSITHQKCSVLPQCTLPSSMGHALYTDSVICSKYYSGGYL